jgi:hypothetical protein
LDLKIGCTLVLVAKFNWCLPQNISRPKVSNTANYTFLPSPKNIFVPQSFKHCELFSLYGANAPPPTIPPPPARVLPPPHTNHPLENSKSLSHPQDNHHVGTSPLLILALSTAPLNKIVLIDQSTGAASAAVSATVPDPLHRRPPHLTSFINSTVHCTGSTSPTLSSTALKYRRPPLIRFTATDSNRNRTGATTASCSARDLLHFVPHVHLLSRFTDLTVHCMDLLH